MQQEHPVDPIAVAEEFAATHRTPDLRLDFSLESLETEVDRILALPIFCRRRDRPETEAEERSLAMFCAYVGETLRRVFHGEWVGEFHRGKWIFNYYRSKLSFGEFRFNPHAFVSYRLTNGPEEGTFREYLQHIVPLIKSRVADDDPHFE